MGWDFTLHPVSEQELQRFLFDVVDDPARLDERLAELCPDERARPAMRALFEQTLRVVDRERAEQDEDDEHESGGADDEYEPGSAGVCVRWLAAAVAACRHPCWSTRDAGLQLVGDLGIRQMFRRLAEIGSGEIEGIEDEGGPRVRGNFEASGFIRPADVQVIALRIEAHDPILLEAFGGAGARAWESLTLAVAYANSRGLGLIEATEFMVPGLVLTSERSNIPAFAAPIVDVEAGVIAAIVDKHKSNPNTAANKIKHKMAMKEPGHLQKLLHHK